MKLCYYCYHPLPAGIRADAKFCSAECRIRSFRENQRWDRIHAKQERNAKTRKEWYRT